MFNNTPQTIVSDFERFVEYEDGNLKIQKYKTDKKCCATEFLMHMDNIYEIKMKYIDSYHENFFDDNKYKTSSISFLDWSDGDIFETWRLQSENKNEYLNIVTKFSRNELKTLYDWTEEINDVLNQMKNIE